MEKISNFFDRGNNRGNNGLPSSEYQYIVKMFLDELNADLGTFAPVTAGHFARTVKHIKGNQEKMAFYKWCKEAKSFPKAFWWGLKPDKTRWSKKPKQLNLFNP